MKTKLLQKIYQFFPFPIKGDADVNMEASVAISCILPTYKRDEDLEVLLHCLSEQDLNKKDFEVIAVEDGENDATRQLIQRFITSLHLIHLTNPAPLHNVACLRNKGLACSRGEVVLFLDDDTILPQKDFLSKLVKFFADKSEVKAVQIRGEASYALLRIKYDYLDKYSFATRCVAYRRSFLVEIGGFSEELASYEDIELAIRFSIVGGQVARAEHLFYRHPPLYFNGWEKPLCNGLSFLRLFPRYSKPVWLVCYLNALRFLPYLLFPSQKRRQWGKISAGFLWAPTHRIFKKMGAIDDKIIYR